VTKDVLVSIQGNTENNARDARYQAIAAVVEPNAVVCFAHHAQDALETLWLQLKRGAGINGITSMQRQRHMQVADTQFIALRPMLAATKANIEAYAQQHALFWHDDPSNADTLYERNFLRHEVIAPMLSRWPDAGEGIARSLATLSAEKALLQEALEDKLQTCLNTSQTQLCIASWLQLPPHWQAPVLRHWLLRDFQINCSQAQLRHIVQLCHAQADAKAEYRLGEWLFRRFQQQLYVSPWAIANTTEPSFYAFSTAGVAAPSAALIMHQGQLTLPLPASVQALHQLSCLQIALSERIKPFGYAHSKPLKQWCKLLSIPPWQRQPAYLITGETQPLAVVTPFFALVLHAQNTHSVEVHFKN
jgi:tRNA(Ile)-lysidine synthase